MSLAEKLEKTPHREVAGSDAYAAFEFQVMFGVQLLFEKYETLEDFAVLFEFHDDVVLVLGSQSPTEIEFFQLKHHTRGNWTLAKLISTEKVNGKDGDEAKKSIIQKVYDNVDNFSGFTKSAQVVSNAYFAGFGQAQSHKFSSLKVEERAKLLTHLQATHPHAADDCLDILGFRRTELNKTEYHNMVKGRVHTFLQKHVGGDAYPLGACTNAIIQQCRIRNKRLATDVPDLIDEIILQKGITKGDLDSWLHEIAANKVAPDWTVVQNHIGSSWGFINTNLTRQAYERFKVSALDNSNDAQNTLVRHVRRGLSVALPEEPLCDFVDGFIAVNELHNTANDLGFELAELRAAILYEIFRSHQARTIQEAHQKPEKENK